MASKWRWITKNWIGLTLLWFNAIATVLSVALSSLTNWGVGLILFLGFTVAAWLLLWFQTTPFDGGHSDIIIKLTDKAVFRDEHGCYCNHCGSNHSSLDRYPFDPRLHYASCIIAIARQSVEPMAIELAPPEIFETYEDTHHAQEFG